MSVTKGWGAVGQEEGGGRGGKFVSCKDGESVTMRILDMEPMTVMVHSVNAPNASGEDTFRSIQQTERPDDDWIDQQTSRYPAKPRHAIRVAVYDDDDDVIGVRVLEGGKQVFKQLKDLFTQFGDLTDFDVVLSRDGKGIKTTWTVTASPSPNDIDLEHWVDEIESDPQWADEALFPPITPEQQKQIIAEAGIDITYDPVAELMEEMTVAQAKKVVIGFGKYGPDQNGGKGLTVGKVWKVDQGYIMWAADKVTSSDEMVAACRVIIESTGAVTAGDKVAKKKIKPAPETEAEIEGEQDDDPDVEVERDDWAEAGHAKTPETYLKRWFGKGGNEEKLQLAHDILESEGLEWDDEAREAVPIGGAEADEDEDDDDEPVAKKKPAKKAGKKAAAGSDSDDGLRETIMELFAEDDTYDDPQNIVAIVEKHGGGKSRLRDLNTKELKKLRMALIA